MAFALFVLILAPIARSMLKGNSIIELLCRLEFWGAFIIVFFLVCFPITAFSVALFSQSGKDFDLIVAYLPIFFSGLALEVFANGFVRKAQRTAEGLRDPECADRKNCSP